MCRPMRLEGEHEIRGLIGYQTCTESTCDVPTAAEFRAAVAVGSPPDATAVALQYSPARYNQAAQAAARRSDLTGSAPRFCHPPAAVWISAV